MNAGWVAGDTQEVVGALKPQLLQPNSFELFALTGDGGAKTSL